jgi:enamine deaminase RidA (YjgF/YER057c/UK114 family)
MSALRILQPPGWARAKGFSNGIAASGRLVFIAGQIGWTGECKWEARDFAGQFRQALKNILEVLKEATAGPSTSCG